MDGIYIRDKLGRIKKVIKPPSSSLKALIESNKLRRKPKIKVICQICKKIFYVKQNRRNTVKVCSAICRGKYVGIKRRENATPILWSGYMFIKMPKYHRANKQGYAKIADLVLEKKLGRLLGKNEIAHHIDNCKTNDHPNNLRVMTKKQHDKLRPSIYHS